MDFWFSFLQKRSVHRIILEYDFQLFIKANIEKNNNSNKNKHEGLSISTKQKKAQQKYLIVIVQNQGWLLALDCLTV